MTADKKVETFVSFLAYLHLVINLASILLFLIYERDLHADDLIALAILILIHHVVTVLGLVGIRKVSKRVKILKVTKIASFLQRSSRLMSPFDYLHLVLVMAALFPFFFVIDGEAEFSRLEFVFLLAASVVLFVLTFLLFLIVLALSSAFEFEEEVRRGNSTRRQIGVADGGEIV